MEQDVEKRVKQSEYLIIMFSFALLSTKQNFFSLENRHITGWFMIVYSITLNPIKRNEGMGIPYIKMCAKKPVNY